MDEQVGALNVRVDAITVGARYRQDVGDLDPLVASIEKLGLLQPITVTPELALVCGWRRLEAVRRLGWASVRVWVRPGLSDGARHVLAEHDENLLRQAYTKSEQTVLYRELKAALRDEAARNSAAHRFGADIATTPGAIDTAENPDEADDPGPGDSPGPETSGGSGDVRDLAAHLVSGRKAYQAYERIGKLMDLSTDAGQPEEIRQMAADAIARIDAGGQVKPEWDAVQAALARVRPEASNEQVPKETSTGAVDAGPSVAQSPPAPSRAAVRAWVYGWRWVADLLGQHDPDVLGPAVPEDAWAEFRTVLASANDFADRAETARGDVGSEGMGADLDEASARTLAAVIPIGARP